MSYNNQMWRVLAVILQTPQGHPSWNTENPVWLYSGWWQLIYFRNFHPETLGFAWSNLTIICIFQMGWWKTTNYCWWKKSCTSWYGKYSIFYMVSYMSGGAGFLPSTVVLVLWEVVFMNLGSPSLVRDSVTVSPRTLPLFSKSWNHGILL